MGPLLSPYDRVVPAIAKLGKAFTYFGGRIAQCKGFVWNPSATDRPVPEKDKKVHTASHDSGLSFMLLFGVLSSSSDDYFLLLVLLESLPRERAAEPRQAGWLGARRYSLEAAIRLR